MNMYAASRGATLAFTLAFAAVGYGQALAQSPKKVTSVSKTAGASVSTQFIDVSGMSTLPVLSRSTLVSHKAPTDVIRITVSLPPLNAAALQAAADAVSNPKSATYRQFLTPAEVGAKYGQSAATVQKVTDYLKAQGMKVTMVADNHFTVSADGTVAQVEKAFNTTINNYKVKDAKKDTGKPSFYANSEPIQIPKTLGAPIIDVSGTQDYTIPKPSMINIDQARSIYGAATNYGLGNRGEGRTVGISNWDGFLLSNLPLYYSTYKLPTPPGGVGSNVKVVKIGTGSENNPRVGECDGDIQFVLGVVPFANVIVYDGTGGNLLEVLAKQAQDNTSDVISMSWGWNLPDSMTMSAHNIYLAMSLQGITYLASSGDYGTTLALSYPYPTYDGEVLMVGGTVASATAAGVRTSEVGWSGGGGGWWTGSTVPFNKRPVYQVGKGVPTNINFRMSPDVAFNADGNGDAGYPFIYDGAVSGFSGTSASTPLFAGMLAGAQQRLIKAGSLIASKTGKYRFGRLQDLIYSMNGRSDVFLDITSGTNGFLPNGQLSTATAGWDMVTGWGPMNMEGFIGTQTLSKFSLTSVALYSGWGTSPTGTVNSLAADDNQYYTVTTVSQAGTGTVAAFTVGAKAALNPANMTGLTVQMNITGPNQATNYIYLRNWSVTNKAQYDLIASNSLTGSATSLTASIKSGFTNYVNTSGNIEILERAIYPTRLGAVPFQLKVDSVAVSAKQ